MLLLLGFYESPPLHCALPHSDTRTLKFVLSPSCLINERSLPLMKSAATLSKPAHDTMLGWCSLSFWKLRFAEFRKEPETIKIWTMRFVLACFLVGAAAGVSVSSYKRLRESQQKSFESNFQSVAQNALNTVSDAFERLNLSILQFASIYGELFRDEDQWPNVAWDGFHTIAPTLIKVASSPALALVPLVYPNQTASFKKHMVDYYQARPDEYDLYFPYFFPNGSIWVQNNSEVVPTPYDVTTGIIPPLEYYTPVLQYTISPLADKWYVGYDAHADPRYSGGVLSVINCTRKYPYERSFNSCAGITEVTPMPWFSAEDLHPKIDDMTAAFIHPIFPANNHSTLVGFASGSLSWATILQKVTPTFAEPIDCVVHVHDTWFTFTIDGGVPKFKGFGDLHEEKFSKYAIVSGALSPSLNRADINSHRLTLYPTQDFQNAYYDFTPMRGALVMIAIFALCSLLFYLYDILMKREFSRRQAVLDTKRRFVRFISHEIRTPLNTVRLGLKLFEEELNALLQKVEKAPPSELALTVQTSLITWKGLTEEVLESSDSAVEVLDDLLNYDKIEIGTLRLEFGLFDMHGLVTKSVSMMQAHAKQKGVVLILQCKQCEPSRVTSPRSIACVDTSPAPEVLPSRVSNSKLSAVEEGRDAESAVVGDATRLGQVLRNLISNALKFTPSKGEVTVTVQITTAIDQISEKVRLSSLLFQNMRPVGTIFVAVKDSGAGLTEIQLKQIGMEGVQFNANELQAGQGSGLGLFISKGIVEQHGGRLTVASEGLGKGVTFTVELPLFGEPQRRDSNHSFTNHFATKSGSISAVPGLSSRSGDSVAFVQDFNSSADASIRRPLAPMRGLDIPEPAPGAKKIMVVDDSPFNRKMLVRLLTSKGFVCSQAEDGAEALRVYEEMMLKCEVIDAILMDYEMPVMNGPTATKKLRELGCTCLIVGVTGNVLPDQVGSFKSHGADAVLPKPLVMEDLQFLLNKFHHNNTNTTAASPAMKLLMKTASTTEYSYSAVASTKVHPIEG